MGKLERFVELFKRGIDTSEEDQEPKASPLAPELTLEREQEMMDQLVKQVKKWKMELPAIVLLQMLVPVTRPYSQLYGFYAAPFMELFGIHGYDYALFFSKKNNVKELIKRIREEDDRD